MRFVSCAVLAVALGLSACNSGSHESLTLGSARVVSDFDSYTLRRVGLLPIEGLDSGLSASREMAVTLGSEFAGRTGLEILVLSTAEVSEVPSMAPHRNGGFDLETIIRLGKRHRLDALLVATIVERRENPPQSIALQVDLVSTETGLSLWFGQVRANAAEGRTKRAVEAWVVSMTEDRNSDWRVALLSPKQFYRFACHQVMRPFKSGPFVANQK